MFSFKSHNYILIAVLVGIALIAWQTFSGSLDYQFQQIFFIVAVFTLGIPHGAFDFAVEQELCRLNKSQFHAWGFRLKSLSTILIYGLFWFFLPQVSLLAFLIMSSWHFGETDLPQMMAWPLYSSISRLIYGACILLWIIFGHAAESGVIISHLIPANSIVFELWLAGVAHTQVILLISAVTLVLTLSINQLQKQPDYWLWLIFQLVVILTCCYFLPLLPAFALYFVGWHSLITLNHISRFLNGDIATNKQITTVNLCVKALPATLMAIGTLLLTGYLFGHYAPIFNPLPLLFVFLSLITLMHTQVMYKLNQQLNK